MIMKQLKAAVKTLSKKQLRLIALHAYCGIYQDRHTDIFSPTNDVSGANFISHMQNTLTACGLGEPEEPDED